MLNVLVIGGTRFFGKELVKNLITKGYRVTVLTRGNIVETSKGEVERIFVDKDNEEALKKALEGRFFDIVYNNICYSPNEALICINALEGKTKRCIVTSSVAVYSNVKGEGIKENSFNPYEYKISFGDRENFSYSEGKRLMEAVFCKYAKFDVTFVRFPVVIGQGDYTERLNKYIKEVKNGEKIYTTKKNEKMNIITKEEAGVFLQWLGEKDINGPINATCIGEMTLGDIVEIIEEEVGKKALLDCSKNIDETSPYNSQLNLTVSTAYIRGFFLYRFKGAKSELREVVRKLI